DPIRQTLREMIDHSDLGYLGSIPEMGSAFAGFAQRRWGWTVDPLQVRIAADVGVGVVEVLRVITKPGDKILINSPVYPNFFTWCDETHLEHLDVPLTQSDAEINGSNWILDWDGIERAYASGIKAHLISNPHNPLGRVYTRDELSRLADLARKYKVYILSDEIHAPLTFSEQTFTPFLAISDTAREVGITITAASKGWNIAGLKCAIIVTENARVHETLNAIAPATHYRASLLGAFATVTAFEKGEPWLDQLMVQLDRNRNLVATLIESMTPGVGYRIPHCSYLAWLDLSKFNLGEDPSAVLIEKAKVAFVPGVRFGQQSTQYVRLNFATSPEILHEAFNRLATVLK
ncbi:MAG: aminotransferase class I/II-fold pyridoxal phosphate-dependent enzyme, partial [Actinobacteria bacterium]|nr:aminotransferase class I/II-fold pyridoxal phosphate-dependent enzyme [Actinomycetota bacterium]